MTPQKHAMELMPQDKAAKQILQQRAELLAQKKVPAEKEEDVAYVRFRLAQAEFYGIPYQYVVEVLNKVALVKPPRTPAFIAGVINWRGALVSVIDLEQFLRAKDTKYVHNIQVLVVKTHELTIGILANSIEGSAMYHPSSLEKPLISANAANAKYILGIHDAVTAIIHVETLISALKLETERQINVSI